VNGDLEHRIELERLRGGPLERGLLNEMEEVFGADFKDVRVHTDAQAGHLNQQIGAHAFTLGSDIFFGENTGPGDRKTLAHELTHVVQQRSIEPAGPLTVGPADDAYETEADAVAREVEARPHNSTLSLLNSSTFVGVQQTIGNRAVARMISQTIQRDAGSSNYNDGYQDGLSGDNPHPAPRDGDALTDYEEGYAKGHYEFSQAKPAVSGGTPEPNISPGPTYTPGPSPDQGPNQSVSTPEDKAAYQKGYQDGVAGAPSDPIGRVGFQYAQDYTTGYNAGQTEAKHPMPAPDKTDDNNSTYEGPTIGGISEEQARRNDEFTKQQQERDKGLYEWATGHEDPHGHEEKYEQEEYDPLPRIVGE
jgi:hypothetical protein